MGENRSVMFKPDNKVENLMISGRCSFKCPGCNKTDYFELSTEIWKKILRELKNKGIENIVFGGAEPLMRTDIIELARYAKKFGLRCALNSNGKMLYEYDCDDLSNFEYIIIGWHKKSVIFERCLKQLQDCNIPRVISYCFDKRHEGDLEYIKKCANFYDAEIFFKSYEPTGEKDYENRIPFDDVIKVVNETKKEGYSVSL